MADQTDNLTLNEDKLDYEADEVDQGEETRADSPNSSREEVSSPQQDESKLDKTGDEDGEINDDEKKDNDDDNELESGEELEDGEISDEDEALKNERNEPKAVCRFYNRGHCTWGTSCRFLHPGVLDKGNYNMFATPRSIIPGQPEAEEIPEVEEEKIEEPILMRPPPPAYETAWERGLRQAKEMRRRSHKRREMDVEYEEKKSNLSLTQIELDKENDYYTRPASPAHTHDPYADDEYPDNYDNYYPAETRRIAPPPPADFVARGERAAAVRRGYSESPPPRTRRVAPPRSPSPTIREDPAAPAKSRFRGGEDWADPWMRSKDDKSKASRSRRRSYSSGSSRSSSSRSSSSNSSLRRRRKYSTSPSSRSNSDRSRSRSSTPEGIPRRGGPSLPPPSKNTAPLQKRLGGVVAMQSKGLSGGGSSSRKWAGGESGGPVTVKLEGEKKGNSVVGEQTKVSSHKQPRDPVKLSLAKSQSKVPLKTVTGKPSNQAVLEKLGTKKDELPDYEARKRKLEQNPEHPDSIKQRKLENEELMETLKQRLKSNLEAKQAKEVEAKSSKPKKISDVLAIDKNKDKKKKAIAAAPGAVGGAAAAGTGDAKAKRKEELLKQLKAVEEAIHRKRTKLDK